MRESENKRHTAKKKGALKMAVMAKPLNISLRVSEDKKKEFLSMSRNTKAMIERFKRLKKAELLSGKKDTDSEIKFLNKKIQEFEEELKG